MPNLQIRPIALEVLLEEGSRLGDWLETANEGGTSAGAMSAVGLSAVGVTELSRTLVQRALQSDRDSSDRARGECCELTDSLARDSMHPFGPLAPLLLVTGGTVSHIKRALTLSALSSLKLTCHSDPPPSTSVSIDTRHIH